MSALSALKFQPKQLQGSQTDFILQSGENRSIYLIYPIIISFFFSFLTINNKFYHYLPMKNVSKSF